MSEPRRIISKNEYFTRLDQGVSVGNCWVDMGNGELTYAIQEVVVAEVVTGKYKDRRFLPINVSICVADNTRIERNIFMFDGNSPISYTNQTVKTIGDASNSRVKYSGNGVFRIDLDKLHNYTRNNIKAANENPDNWKPGEIGMSTVVAEFRYQQPIPNFPSGGLPRLSSTYDATKEGYTITERNTRAETAQSTGLPDRRVTPRPVTTGNAGGAATRGGAGFMLAIDAFFIGYSIFTAYWVMNDLDSIERDQQLVRDAARIVLRAKANNLIPAQYQNQNDLGAIINFVFQGINETGNKEITEIGIKILKAEGLYDQKKITAKK